MLTSTFTSIVVRPQHATQTKSNTRTYRQTPFALVCRSTKNNSHRDYNRALACVAVTERQRIDRKDKVKNLAIPACQTATLRFKDFNSREKFSFISTRQLIYTPAFATDLFQQDNSLCSVYRHTHIITYSLIKQIVNINNDKSDFVDALL